jgi:hypothetical protein
MTERVVPIETRTPVTSEGKDRVRQKMTSECATTRSYPTTSQMRLLSEILAATRKLDHLPPAAHAPPDFIEEILQKDRLILCLRLFRRVHRHELGDAFAVRREI